MLLIINICKEKLHSYEFVKPIEDILKNKGLKFETKHYKEIDEKNIKKYNRIIICGTSLKDFDYLIPENLKKFGWIKICEKPVLGICGGMQIIGSVFGSKLKKKTEIGLYTEKFKKDFLGLSGEHEVYHLHNDYITLPENFDEFTLSKIPQAIKHKSRQIYGILFHPEVRNTEIIKNFCELQ